MACNQTFSIEKAYRLIGYKPLIRLRDGLEFTIGWFFRRNNASLWTGKDSSAAERRTAEQTQGQLQLLHAPSEPPPGYTYQLVPTPSTAQLYQPPPKHVVRNSTDPTWADASGSGSKRGSLQLVPGGPSLYSVATHQQQQRALVAPHPQANGSVVASSNGSPVIHAALALQQTHHHAPHRHFSNSPNAEEQMQAHLARQQQQQQELAQTHQQYAAATALQTPQSSPPYAAPFKYNSHGSNRALHYSSPKRDGAAEWPAPAQASRSNPPPSKRLAMQQLPSSLWLNAYHAPPPLPPSHHAIGPTAAYGKVQAPVQEAAPMPQLQVRVQQGAP
jgi:hypothetical protein